MRTKVIYEWCCETLDNGDIVDNHFEDKLQDIGKDELPNNDLVLCRAEGNEVDGVTDTLWAYVKNWQLPEYFTDSMQQPVNVKVPAKYHKELLSYFKTPPYC